MAAADFRGWVRCGMLFEHPHSMLDYLFEVMKLFGSETI